MEKAIVPSGVATKLSRERDKFKENLLRKRRTYERYFSRGLVAIDAALRRIAVFRGLRGKKTYNWVDENRNGNASAEYKVEVFHATKDELADMKLAIRGVVVQKEKKSLKKYALRCSARRDAGQRRHDTRNLNWEQKQKLREKKERSVDFGLRLEAVEEYYAAGGRQPGRGEHLGMIPVYGGKSKDFAFPGTRTSHWYPPAFYVVAPPTRDPPTPVPYYFDENGRRIRMASRYSVPV